MSMVELDIRRPKVATDVEKINQALGRIKVSLDISQFEMATGFEESRRHIGAAHGVCGDGIHLTKQGIKLALEAALTGDDNNLDNHEGIVSVRRELSYSWSNLAKLHLPKHVAWQFDAQAGQEIAEFNLSVALWPVILGKQQGEIIYPDHAEFAMTDQAWLAGMCDTIGELSRMTNKVMRKKREMSFLERLEVRERYIDVSEFLWEILDQFETAYEQVIGNSAYRSFFNQYRSRLGRAGRIIEVQESSVLEMREKLAFADYLEERLAKHFSLQTKTQN